MPKKVSIKICHIRYLSIYLRSAVCPDGLEDKLHSVDDGASLWLSSGVFIRTRSFWHTTLGSIREGCLLHFIIVRRYPSQQRPVEHASVKQR